MRGSEPHTLRHKTYLNPTPKLTGLSTLPYHFVKGIITDFSLIMLLTQKEAEH